MILFKNKKNHASRVWQPRTCICDEFNGAKSTKPIEAVGLNTFKTTFLSETEKKNLQRAANEHKKIEIIFWFKS